MLNDGEGVVAACRPVIEQWLEQLLAATVRGGGVSWETWRQRGFGVLGALQQVLSSLQTFY